MHLQIRDLEENKEVSPEREFPEIQMNSNEGKEGRRRS